MKKFYRSCACGSVFSDHRETYCRTCKRQTSNLKLHTCTYVKSSEVIPRRFMRDISENAPFSWGDNDHSLVNARDFAIHCKQRLDDSEEVQAFLDRLWILDDIYIDLES